MLDGLDIYVPRDEELRHLKLADSFAFVLKSLGHATFPGFDTLFHPEFDSFEDTLDIYKKTPDYHQHLLNILPKYIHSDFIKAWLSPDGGDAFHLPMPQVIEGNNNRRSDM